MSRRESLGKIVNSICSIQKKAPILVGVDGRSGSGKSTLAKDLEAALLKMQKNVTRISIDDFHNSEEQRYRQGKLSPLGYFEDSFDYDFLIKQFLKPVSKCTEAVNVTCGKFDWRNDSLNEKKVTINKSSIILFEGVFLFRSEIVNFWDLKIYVKISPETSVKRGLRRDSDFLGSLDIAREKYAKRYLPGELIYHDKYEPQSIATIVIENETPSSPKVVYTK